MCFSATASFTAAAVLFAVGVASYREARSSSYALLASIPLLFAVQQGFEGVVWLAVDGVLPVWAGSIGAYGFLAFAISAWPAVFPRAARRIRGSAVTKVCSWLGAAWAALSALVLVLVDISYTGVGGHISYDIISVPGWIGVVLTAVYAGIGIAPLLRGPRSLQVVGGAFLVSGVASYVAMTQWFTSVWCFFAAMLSVAIYAVVRRNA